MAMSEKNTFEFGDRVRHGKRPEWGIGTVVKVEHTHLNGQRWQSLSIRFPNAGLKTINTQQAELERMDASADPLADNHTTNGHPVSMWDKLNASDWLGGMAKRKVEEAMISLSAEAKDPFSSLQRRLAYTLGLYRFDRSGRGMVDWAVAQSGLDDPLSRFNRHELEQYFDRWAHERDAHLAKLLSEARDDRAALAAAVKGAPSAGQDAVRRLTASR